MKITLSGAPGSGKSTLRAKLADHYGLKIKATGDFMREIAQKYGYSDITKFLMEYLVNNPEVDIEIDNEQKRYGTENDDFVLDAHLGFHFVPDAMKILLNCRPEVAAQRIFDANRSTEDAKTVEETLVANQKRLEGMKANFKKLYDVDMHDPNNFDLVFETADYTPEEVFQQVKAFIDQSIASK